MQVHFDVPMARIFSSSKRMREVLLEAIGITENDIQEYLERNPYTIGEYGASLKVQCTPEEFVKFIVLRNAKGENNGIKELNISYIEDNNGKSTQTD